MSRAFVKETDTSTPPPERMSDGPNLVTREGHAQIESEVVRLEAALKTETNVLLRETLARDLRYWQIQKARAEIVSPRAPDGSVAFGSRITLRRNGRDQTFRIVGEDEAAPSRGLVSWRSPLAQAVLGARAGEIVEAEKLLGEIEILRVEA